ncbi:hypothetical protein THRCLA_20733 [Thraustotheca clavata]|uniref:Uncharacterized protein n=1 Tax=Thraustotheca clavata TaxID=74557 RepID=A0A1W0A4T1_9STRA|nr:hypothetical protein THRCLA_20733 [Thraustotheca clavata]
MYQHGIDDTATASVLYDVMLQKKSKLCRVKMLQEAKCILATKADIEACQNRLKQLSLQFKDVNDERLQEQKEDEESLLIELKNAFQYCKATMRILIRHKTSLEHSLKSLRHRQRRIVEKAYRSGLLQNQL